MLATPSRWGIRRLREVAELRVSNVDKHEKDGEVPVRLCNYVDVYKNDRITERIRFMRATAAEDEVERFRLRRGDVLITKDSETWTDIGVPALVEYEAPDLVSGYHLALLRPRHGRIGGAFLFRALQSADVAHQFHVRATGVTRYGLSHGDIKSVVVPVPPLDEQAAVVRFLDHADRRIRRAIRAKQKLIALLNEQKRSLIRHAVTRGLSPAALLKDSGIEWMGAVPAHWRIARIKEVARMESGHTPSRSNADHWLDDNDIPWVSLNDTKQLDRVDYISDTALHVNALGLQNSSARLLPAGAVVFTRDAAVGKAAITTRPMAVSQHLIAWICGPELLDTYLLRVIYAMSDELRRLTLGATIPTIGMDDIRGLATPLPPLEEQKEIATHIESGCSRIDRCLDLVRGEIGAIDEYRTRLVADVVTGKLDVREAAARLLDEAGESELLDEIDVEETYEPVVDDLEAVEA